MKRFVRSITLIAALLLWAGLGYTVWREGGAIRRAEQRVLEQQAEIAAAEREKSGLKDDIQRVGDEMAALPDSVQSAQHGKVIRASQSIAKREMHLDGLITRAGKRIENALEQRSEAIGRLTRRGFATGIPALILTLAFFVMRRGR